MVGFDLSWCFFWALLLEGFVFIVIMVGCLVFGAGDVRGDRFLRSLSLGCWVGFCFWGHPRSLVFDSFVGWSLGAWVSRRLRVQLYR